nr:elongation factor G-2, mitochondrial [Tanacetum cinerariifolium]
MAIEKRHELFEAVSDVDDQLAATFLDDEPISCADLEYGGKEGWIEIYVESIKREYKTCIWKFKWRALRGNIGLWL